MIVPLYLLFKSIDMKNVKGFKKILDLNKDIPQELREQMYNNLLKKSQLKQLK